MVVESHIPTDPVRIPIKICTDEHVGCLEFRAMPINVAPDGMADWPPSESYTFAVKILHILLCRGMMPDDMMTIVDQIYYTKVATVYGATYHYIYMPSGKYVPTATIDDSQYFIRIQAMYTQMFPTSQTETRDRNIQHALTQHTEDLSDRMGTITRDAHRAPMLILPIYSTEQYDTIKPFFENTAIQPEVKVLASMLIQDNEVPALTLAINTARSLLLGEEVATPLNLAHLHAHINPSNWSILTRKRTLTYIRICRLYMSEIGDTCTSKILTDIIRS